MYSSQFLCQAFNVRNWRVECIVNRANLLNMHRTINRKQKCFHLSYVLIERVSVLNLGLRFVLIFEGKIQILLTYNYRSERLWGSGISWIRLYPSSSCSFWKLLRTSWFRDIPVSCVADYFLLPSSNGSLYTWANFCLVAIATWKSQFPLIICRMDGGSNLQYAR